MMKKFILLSILVGGCHSATEQSLPKQPDVISCVGHRHSYCIPGFSKDYPTSYAYWSETIDSTHAALHIGFSSVDTTSIFLIFAKFWGDSTLQWWKYNGVDSTVSDSTVQFVDVTISQDSIIIQQSFIDCGTLYYLKKLQ
jgi:hypothetical protein